MSRGGAPKGLLRELWDGPGKWLVPVLAGWAFGVGIMVPVITDITEDYFASAYPLLLVRGGSRAVHNGICPEHPAPENAERCAGAIAASVGVASYADAVGSLITFLLSAGLGRLSDELGRRPFVLASFCIPQIAHLALAFYYSSTVRGWSVYVDLWVYLSLKTISSSLPISMALAYYADALSPRNRAGGFGIVLCCFSGAIIVGPKIGAVLPTETALWLALGLGASGLLAGFLFLPETLSPEKRLTAQRSRHIRVENSSGAQSRLTDFFDSVLILTRDRFFLVLAAVAATDGAAVQGLQDVSLYYLKSTFGADVQFRSTLLEAVGFVGLVTQGLLLRPMVYYLGERWLLIIGLAATAGFIAAYGVLGQMVLTTSFPASSARAMLLTFVIPLNAMAMITFPAISALKANHASDEEQGQVQGALNGARSLASGIGPLLTAQLWRALPVAPYVVYYCLCAVVVVSLLVALTVLPRARTLGSGLGALKEPLLDVVTDSPSADAGAAGREAEYVPAAGSIDSSGRVTPLHFGNSSLDPALAYDFPSPPAPRRRSSGGTDEESG